MTYGAHQVEVVKETSFCLLVTVDRAGQVLEITEEQVVHRREVIATVDALCVDVTVSAATFGQVLEAVEEQTVDCTESQP